MITINNKKTYSDLFLIEKEIKKIMPHFSISAGGYTLPGCEPENLSINHIDYPNLDCSHESIFYVPRPSTLIHYTPSLENLSNIINTGSFRANDLRKMNDKLEMKYAFDSSGLTLTSEILERERLKTFCLSACDFNEQLENENMWKKYGGTGKGAALVFELSGKGYFNFHPIKISYNINEFKEILQQVKNLIEILKEYSFNEPQYAHFLATLMSFFKNPIPKNTEEKEVRLLMKEPRDDHFHLGSNPNIYKFINSDGTTTFYKNILFSNYKGIANDTLDETPYVSLKKIILGSQNKSHHIHQQAFFMTMERFSGDIPVVPSSVIF